jgi:hypothetical protein
LTAGIKPGSVQLFADGQPLAQGAEALWQLSPGTHRFEATATNAEGEPVQVEAVEIEVHE